ncbi:hypothetical protein A3F29_01405 [Candidatus Roizmanbacteria bacterium RIFCSPHIGHO2_12_FULL_33_9]|uniref:Heat-inducible transcription repressor HrcA C-terminal domain-containing protein n=1 Tax=Candidatus Roizmanbacteria bacterium RIFCSPHIGHO2_12_FULL_33_9 TaxID=1802045 RepID=A0A1F7HK34_9BACT|nr:MAG: hypothetical protein A3F29_01405 [Candidatus Roizmanbacteria bacterium RIFCSPHIGHO2_12_FULL_33_9]
MEDLTARQIDILKAVITEYSESGLPIGSEILEKKYKLGVSPATVRNEMVQLAKKGYLSKSYFSSGRIPSAKGFRFYINNLMEEKILPTTDEIAYKNSIWDDRKDAQKLLSHATKILAQKTNLLALAATDAGDLYYSGVGNLLAIDEFININTSRSLFDILDKLDYWGKIIERALGEENEIFYMLGEDGFSDPILEECGSIFGEFDTDNFKGIIGVVGPKRMYYESLTPQVKYFSDLIEKVIQDKKV